MAAPRPTADASSLSALSGSVRDAWSRLAPRERRAVALAGWVIGLGLLWWLAIGPALQTLRQAPQQHARLDSQLRQMREWAASAEQVRALNISPAPGRAAAVRALEQSMALLGDGSRLSVQAESANVVVQNAPPEALARWLNQLRINARLLPVQAQLRPSGPASWSGQITLTGPGLRSETQ